MTLKYAADGSWTNDPSTDLVSTYAVLPTEFASSALPGSSSDASSVGSSSAVAFGSNNSSGSAIAVQLPTIPASETAEIAFINGVNSNGSLAGTSYWTDNNTVAHKWGANTVGTTGGTITYSFSGFDTAQQATLTECINLWSAVCNVKFSYVASGGALTLKMGTDKAADTSDGYSQTGGASRIATTTSSVLSIDPTANGFELDGSFSVNSGYGIGTAVHELGHVLGLGHAGNYNGSVNSSTQQNSAYDTRLWSVMSYIEPTDSSAKYYSSYPVTGTNWGNAQTSTTMMPLDLLATQELYGAATSGPLQGGQVFGFNTNVASSISNFFDFTVNTAPVITIWDAGSGNTLDLSGYSASETVNLNPGTFSDIAGLANNVAIAYNTKIDTAVGGTGNDVFVVNGDNDTISGGGGSDEVMFSGNRSAYTLSRSGNVVTVAGNGATDMLTAITSLVFADQTTQASDIACFLRGTSIGTPTGEMPVEALQIGDAVVTASGQVRPLKWIGRRSYAARFARGNERLLPIRIKAGALADAVPLRDLLVSPKHAMLLEGCLVPAERLVNGSSIAQEGPGADVEYFHLELESHDVVLANGAPSETFLNDDSRGMFQNVVEYRQLYPGEVESPARYCAPRVEDGHELDVIRRQIDARAVRSAGHKPNADDLLLNDPRLADPRPGNLEAVSRGRISGWARLPKTLLPVVLQVFSDGVLLARIVADTFRWDLLEAGIGEGRHGFALEFAAPLSPLMRHIIEVRREADGVAIPGSPFVLEPADKFDPVMQQAIVAALGTLGDPALQEQALSFMVEQVDRLLQQRADIEGGREPRAAVQQFRRRWGSEHTAVAEGRRALVMDVRAPAPDRDAGSQALLSHISALQALGYAVAFVATEDMHVPQAAQELLATAGVQCLGRPFYASAEDVLSRQTGCFDVVYLHRADVAAQYMALARRFMPKARVLYNVADLHHLRLSRQAAFETRPDLLAQAHRLRMHEHVAALCADAVLTHSPHEAAALQRAVPQARVHTVPWHVAARPTCVPSAHRRGLAFIGGFGHAPNADAADWLVHEVMPLVWRVDPSIQCLLAGSDMPEAMLRLETPGVTVLGHVDDLTATVFDRVRLTVAPLRFGAGIKGKVLASFAAGVPCVTTPVAAEGLALGPALRALVADGAAALAATICRVHADEAEQAAVAEAGLALIGRDYTSEATLAALSVAISGGSVALAATG